MPLPGTITHPGPERPVTVDALIELGVIVVQGNEQDVKAILQLIDELERIGRESEVTVVMVPLEKGDATEIVYFLNQLYSRVNLRPQRRQQPAAAAHHRRGGERPPGPAATTTSRRPRSPCWPCRASTRSWSGRPRLRINDVINEIKRFDHDTSPQMHATPFPLRHRSASKVGQTIVNFWSTRWTGETANQHQVRITWDDSANTIYVQAAPADMKEIGELILNMDTSEPKSTSSCASSTCATSRRPRCRPSCRTPSRRA